MKHIAAKYKTNKANNISTLSIRKNGKYDKESKSSKCNKGNIDTKDIIKTTHINPFIVLNVSLYVLAAICFMIHATGQSYTFAEGESDLGYDLQSVDASVTVGTACTFTGTITSPHTANISNGIYSDNIGTTVLNTKCNDSGGYALYAIGYTNDEYGATDLSSDISTTYNIPTGTSTTGNTSSWSMKLNQVSGTTPATIENNYNNYNIVPDGYTKIATLNTVTDTPSTSSATGSSVSTTYSAYISPTQPAGTYTGKVKYTLVHPSTAPAPQKPMTINDLTYMQDFKDLSAEDKTSVLGSMKADEQYQLKDSRDRKDYYISKLADGNVWMTQNLDLDLISDPTAEGYVALTPANTNITADWTPANNTISFTGTSVPGWQNDKYVPYSADPGDVYYYTSNTSDDDIKYNSLAECEAAGHTDCAHYHAGNYYNWSAAAANNNTAGITGRYTNVETSICPAGWRLPTGTDNKNTAASREWNAVLYAEGVASSPTGDGYTSDGFNKIRTAPLWLARSGGVYGGSSLIDTGGGYYWSSTVESSSSAYRLYFNSGGVSPAYGNGRGGGYSVRCVAQ